jgi:hypothetical protein
MSCSEIRALLDEACVLLDLSDDMPAEEGLGAITSAQVLIDRAEARLSAYEAQTTLLEVAAQELRAENVLLEVELRRLDAELRLQRRASQLPQPGRLLGLDAA